MSCFHYEILERPDRLRSCIVGTVIVLWFYSYYFWFEYRSEQFLSL